MSESVKKPQPHPCPYCGSKDVRLFEANYFAPHSVCANCSARGPHAPTIEDAVEAWNRVAAIVRVHDKRVAHKAKLEADKAAYIARICAITNPSYTGEPDQAEDTPIVIRECNPNEMVDGEPDELTPF